MGITRIDWNFRCGRSVSSAGRVRTAWIMCVGIVVVLCVLPGCDFRRVVVNESVPAENLQLLHPGESSLRDVVQVLGAPDDIDGTTTGMALRYWHGNTKTMRVNFGWVLRVFLPVAPSLNLGRGENISKILHVAINRDNRLEHYLVQDPPVPPRFWFWPF